MLEVSGIWKCKVFIYRRDGLAALGRMGNDKLWPLMGQSLPGIPRTVAVMEHTYH